jgi:hypothetical protein
MLQMLNHPIHESIRPVISSRANTRSNSYTHLSIRLPLTNQICLHSISYSYRFPMSANIMLQR